MMVSFMRPEDGVRPRCIDQSVSACAAPPIHFPTASRPHERIRAHSLCLCATLKATLIIKRRTLSSMSDPCSCDCAARLRQCEDELRSTRAQLEACQRELRKAKQRIVSPWLESPQG